MQKFSNIAARLVYKIRHHKGHGIHSPFVFGLITNVIEEKKKYYAYNDIPQYLERFDGVGFKQNKISRLLFRLVNHFGAKQILVLGIGNGINTLYLTAPASDIECVSCGKIDEVTKIMLENWSRNIKLSSELLPSYTQKIDCIFVDLYAYQIHGKYLIPYLITQIKESGFIVIRGIRTNKKNRLLWKSLMSSNEVSVSLDLFHLGILFFSKKYHKHNYKLSF